MADRYLAPALYVTWQDHQSRKIFPVGRLVRLLDPPGAYEFAYVQGAHEAEKAGFRPFLTFPSRSGVYRSQSLLPFFTNRVMSKGRPDYASFVRRLDLAPETAGPDEILARSGGVRATDTVEIFAEPTRQEDGRWQAIFLVRSIRHLHAGEETASSLQVGQRLFCMLDIQNPRNRRAVALRTEDHRIVGFCPDYLTDYLDEILLEDPAGEATVLAISPPPAPVHYRVLCELVFRAPADTTPPLRSPKLEPISPDAVQLEVNRGGKRVA